MFLDAICNCSNEIGLDIRTISGSLATS